MMRSIDLDCANFGQRMADAVLKEQSKKEAEKLLLNCLGILQEEGVYAQFLWLAAQRIKGDNSNDLPHPAAYAIRFWEADLIRQFDSAYADQQDPADYVRERLSRDLNRLVLCKQLLERTLMYARYHVRAANEKQGARK